MKPQLLPLFLVISFIAAAQQPSDQSLHHDIPSTKSVEDRQSKFSGKSVKTDREAGTNYHVEFDRKGAQADTGFADAYYSVANMYLMMEEYERAAEYFLLIINENPYFMTAYTGLAEAYYKQGKFEQAFKACDQALQVNANFKLAYYKLGEIYISKGEYEKAVENFEAAVALDPYFTEAFEELYQLYDNQLDDAEKAEYYKTKLTAAPLPQFSIR